MLKVEVLKVKAPSEWSVLAPQAAGTSGGNR